MPGCRSRLQTYFKCVYRTNHWPNIYSGQIAKCGLPIAGEFAKTSTSITCMKEKMIRAVKVRFILKTETCNSFLSTTEKTVTTDEIIYKNLGVYTLRINFKHMHYWFHSLNSSFTIWNQVNINISYRHRYKSSWRQFSPTSGNWPTILVSTMYSWKRLCIVEIPQHRRINFKIVYSGCPISSNVNSRVIYGKSKSLRC